VEPHFSAGITIVGMIFDVLGGLYLAYEVLGAGSDGYLRRITRIANYSVIETLILLLLMGPKFALVAGIGMGGAVGWHIDRIAHSKPDTLLFLACLGLLRAIAVSSALCIVGHQHFAVFVFFLLIVISIVLPRFNVSPAAFYEVGVRPQLKKEQLIIAVLFGAIAGGAALMGSYISAGGNTHHIEFAFAGQLALAISCAILAVSSLSPMIEYVADNLPDRFFGYLGVAMFRTGFVIQAIPSLVVLLDGVH
jgi:hypothetical protein